MRAKDRPPFYIDPDDPEDQRLAAKARDPKNPYAPPLELFIRLLETVHRLAPVTLGGVHDAWKKKGHWDTLARADRYARDKHALQVVPTQGEAMRVPGEAFHVELERHKQIRAWQLHRPGFD